MNKNNVRYHEPLLFRPDVPRKMRPMGIKSGDGNGVMLLYTERLNLKTCPMSHVTVYRTGRQSLIIIFLRLQ
eukprot:UN20368